MRRKKIIIIIFFAVLPWGLLSVWNGAFHRRAYEALLRGEKKKSLALLKFVVAREPVFFIHRGAMGGRSLAGAFAETGERVENDLAWTLDTGAPVISSPLAASGAVYIGNNADTLFKISAATGKILWRYRTGGDIETKPLLIGSMVYAAAHDGLHAVDARTGRLKWFRPIRWAESSPEYGGGAIYIGTDDGFMLALSPETGAEKWRFRAAGPIESSPAAASGMIYFGCNKGIVYSLAAESGKPKWSYAVGGRVEGGPLVMAGAVYIGGTTGKFVALDGKTGKEKWSKNLGGSIESSAAGGADVIVIGTRKGRVFGLRPADGAALWTYRNAGPVESSPLIHNDVVYIGSHYGFIHALDARSGRKISRFLTGWDIDESSPAAADGLIIVGAMDGRVYAIKAERRAPPLR